MAATMKALRKMQAAKGLQMDTVAVPLIGPTDVLVRVKTASICGTDLHIYGWDRWSQGRIKPPVTLGHEFCGTVERIGDEVAAVKPGDFVIEYLEAGSSDTRALRRDSRSAGKRGPHRAGRADCGTDGLGNRLRADWIDVDCGGPGLREVQSFCDGDERKAACDGQENGRGRGAESSDGRCSGKNSLGNERDGSRRAAGDVRESHGDSARLQSSASGRARLAAGDSDGKCSAGFGERCDLQGCNRAGNLRAAHV